MCRNEIIIMMERERVLSWPELCLTGSWPALPLATLVVITVPSSGKFIVCCLDGLIHH